MSLAFGAWLYRDADNYNGGFLTWFAGNTILCLGSFHRVSVTWRIRYRRFLNCLRLDIFKIVKTIVNALQIKL